MSLQVGGKRNYKQQTSKVHNNPYKPFKTDTTEAALSFAPDGILPNTPTLAASMEAIAGDTLPSFAPPLVGPSYADMAADPTNPYTHLSSAFDVPNVFTDTLNTGIPEPTRPTTVGGGYQNIGKTSNHGNNFTMEGIGKYSGKTMSKRYNSLNDKSRGFYDGFNGYMLKKHGFGLGIASGGRTQEEQNYIYEQGRTRPGNKVTWTKNSRHIGGGAMDITGPQLYDDPKQNMLIAREMRAYAKANPQYGAEFLSLRKDPNHVQFN